MECGGLPLLSGAKLASRYQSGSKLPHSKDFGPIAKTVHHQAKRRPTNP
jgi:hypothetical protein